MRMYDLILKKRNGGKLTEDEIRTMITDYTNGSIPDYQMSAMMMAIYFNGLDKDETLWMTLAMEHSGEVLDLSSIKGIKADKHSTGGVGDKTSLAVTPMVAVCGLKIAKMSGRGLGHTGGTIDKLESIPGFSTDLTPEHFVNQVNDIGIAIMGQTKDLAPADKKLYALRDVTATVDQMSLIASSIMSKKLASNADVIVLDVKTGSGAFMKSLEDAKALAKEMTEIGHGAGKVTKAVISNMDQPLGRAVGNAIEVREAIDTLNGEGPEDFTKLVFTIGSQLLIASGMYDNESDAKAALQKVIDDGSALNKFAAFVKAQGGDESYVYHPENLPCAKLTVPVVAERDGYIKAMDCEKIGLTSLILGGGRVTKESAIDLSVGLTIEAKVGDYVKKGETLAVLYANDEAKAKEAGETYRNALTIVDEACEKQKIILDMI
ncbi:MAG: pyrimidine-nucleoside phosphorylase [Lachnospiraceae bacterium]|nr:pyrimidine-nucleoside phosphorylase [Lachnospiraceae bacterium]